MHSQILQYRRAYGNGLELVIDRDTYAHHAPRAGRPEDSRPHPADGVTPATCLDFFATGQQIACWTNLETDDPSVNTSDMSEIINSGNLLEVSAGEKYYIDNGTKTPLLDDISDRFHGWGKYAGKRAGTDLTGDGLSNTWVVGLPVIACQDGINCAKGDPIELKGVVCFEIQQIEVVPEKRIMGRFLCKGDAAYKDCDIGLTGTGGKDFDIRADFPVLVR